EKCSSTVIDIKLIVNRTSLEVDHHNGIVRILTEDLRTAKINSNVLSIDLFRDIVLCTVEQFTSGRRNPKPIDIATLMEDEIRSRSRYDSKDSQRVLVYRVFLVLQNENADILTQTVDGEFNLNKSVDEVKEWLDRVLSENR
ncbi:hypothetical protein, partial [Geobacillus sp. CAMR5420]|uniref:hypothetical protein n=1 Tax=Geobacillus sp. CAMR5420 TaxID=1482739 RepID=UPI000517BECF